jgi:egghead protein (zeste-white 4 protein)
VLSRKPDAGSAHDSRAAETLPVIGYVRARRHAPDAAATSAIDEACERAGWSLRDVVSDPERARGSERPGLVRALESIAAEGARGLVTADVESVSESIVDLAALLEWFRRAGATFIALNIGLDTSTAEGRRAATTLITLGERARAEQPAPARAPALPTPPLRPFGPLIPQRFAAFAGAEARMRAGTYAVPSEPKRDWAFARLLTGHRLRVVACMTFVALLLYRLQGWLWPTGRSPSTLLEQGWSWGTLLWLGAVIPGTLGLLGMLAYRHSHRLDGAPPIHKLVCFRIVSRGTNAEALLSTVRRCQLEMAKTPLFPYLIELVTDSSVLDVVPPNDDIAYIVVPDEYRTPNRSLYKARALHYAVQHSVIPNDAWIVHLDEETQPTSSGIKGICAMIREEEESGRLRIGQGAILYHREWGKHPFLTLADNVRTGDDFARFHFQHKLGITVFGLHGSYIVVRNDLEKQTGFDFGAVGSITEDAFWALVAMQAGYRCRWVDGYLEEQATHSIGDFVRQRRRWWQGLWKVALHAPVKLRWRACIGINTALWALAPFAALYTVGHFFFGFEVRGWVRLLANLSYASFATLYLVGLVANLDEHGITNPLPRVGWAMAQIVLLPVYTFMEGMGVLSAILKPAQGFHVVDK